MISHPWIDKQIKHTKTMRKKLRNTGQGEKFYRYVEIFRELSRMDSEWAYTNVTRTRDAKGNWRPTNVL